MKDQPAEFDTTTGAIPLLVSHSCKQGTHKNCTGFVTCAGPPKIRRCQCACHPWNKAAGAKP